MDGNLGYRFLRSGFLLLRLAIDNLPFVVETVSRQLGVLCLFICSLAEMLGFLLLRGFLLVRCLAGCFLLFFLLGGGRGRASSGLSFSRSCFSMRSKSRSSFFCNSSFCLVSFAITWSLSSALLLRFFFFPIVDPEDLGGNDLVARGERVLVRL